MAKQSGSARLRLEKVELSKDELPNVGPLPADAPSGPQDLAPLPAEGR